LAQLRLQQERVGLGVRELPPRDRLKFSAMSLNRWRISRAVALD
jgi:hypothetical protein